MMNPDKSVQIVLIGASGSGKSSSGNTILGKKLFKTEASGKSVTVSCESKTEFINGWKVTVVDTPGWDCTELPESEVKSQIRQTLQCLQGPFSFLLVLRVGAVESKDINKIYGLQHLLGHSYLDHTTILFSHSDDLEQKTSEDFLSEGDEEFKKLLRKCSNRCYFWNNRETRSDKDVEKILQDLKKTETEFKGFENKKPRMDEEPSSNDMDSDEEGNKVTTESKSQESITMDAQTSSQNIRVLFLGMSKVGKTSSIKTIVGKCGENAGALNYTCPKSGLNLELIESPGFDDSPEQIQKAISKSLSDCAPGPHVIILVMSIGRFSPATKRIMKYVQDSLGSNGSKHTMILFTGEDDLEGKPIKTYINENQDLSELVKSCGSKFHAFNNRNIRDRTQVEELLQKISEIYERNTGGFDTNEEWHPDSKQHEGLDTWRFVLLGKTGVGKSATGNTILGERLFHSEIRDTSLTTKCNAQKRVVNQRCITVMDTPGLYDSKMSNDDVMKEIVRGLQMIAPGPHAFLLVIDVKRFTDEEKNTVRNLQLFFGNDVHKHMFVIFTRGDDLEYDNKTPEQFISEAGRDLQQLISACGNRYHVFNNKTKDHKQVQNFLEKVFIMLSLNNGEYYSYGLFKQAQEIKEESKDSRDKERRIAELEAQVCELQSKNSHRKCSIQ